ncbi:MAG TPA: hypothetical protein VGG02_04270 [Chthoniobacterales bacterium]
MESTLRQYWAEFATPAPLGVHGDSRLFVRLNLSALEVTLPSGAYTAVLAGKNFPGITTYTR